MIRTRMSFRHRLAQAGLLAVVLLLAGCNDPQGESARAAAASGSASTRAEPERESDLPTLKQVATQSQPILPMLSFEPVVQEFADGEVTLNTREVSVQVSRVTYTAYGVEIDAQAEQHASVLGGVIYLNYGDRGALRDDRGNTYHLRDPRTNLRTQGNGYRWKLHLVAHGFLPAQARRLTLSLNIAGLGVDTSLVEASWPLPVGLAERQQPAARDVVEPGRGWRFGTPPSGNSPKGTASVRLYGVQWLRDGIAVELEALNGNRDTSIVLNSRNWLMRLVDDRGRSYRIAQNADLSKRALSIRNGGRLAGRVLFAPNIAPDARRLRLLTNGGPENGDPWAVIGPDDDSTLSPNVGVAFDIPPASLPGLPAAAKQRIHLNMTQTVPPQTLLPVSRIDPIARLKQELGASEDDRGTTVELPGDVLFDFDRASLRPDANATLDKLAELLTRVGRPAAVAGYTDSKGDDAYNRTLSFDRANAVRDALTRRGVAPSTLTAAGYGEQNPKAANQHPDGSDNPEGRQRNRRVEVVIRR